MADILGQMFFTSKVGSRMAGWSEGVYVVQAGNLPAALSSMLILAPLRANLLGANVWMPYIRVSDRLVYRDSQVSGGPPGPSPVRPALPRPPLIMGVSSAGVSPPLAGTAAPGDWIFNNDLRPEADASGNVSDLRCDMPWTGVLLRCEGGTTFQSRRSMLLRGLPDYITQSALDVPQAGVWANALQRYVDMLTGGTFGFRANDLSVANPVFLVTGINNTTTTPVFTYAAAAPPGGGPPPAGNVAVGQVIRLTGTRLVNNVTGEDETYDGTWTVLTTPNPNQFTLRDLVAWPSSMVLKMGSFRVRKMVVLAFNKVLGRRWGKRPVGAPFDPFHGRHKPKKSA